MIAVYIFIGLALYEGVTALTHAFMSRSEANSQYRDACQDWLSRNNGGKHGH